MYKKIRVKKIIAAAEKNGYPWRGNNSLRNFDELGVQLNFCVLEQASLNLGLGKSWVHLSDGLNQLVGGLGEMVWRYNDDQAIDYKSAFSYMKEILEPYINKTVEILVDE